MLKIVRKQTSKLIPILDWHWRVKKVKCAKVYSYWSLGGVLISLPNAVSP